jgi:hypothetical protein
LPVPGQTGRKVFTMKNYVYSVTVEIKIKTFPDPRVRWEDLPARVLHFTNPEWHKWLEAVLAIEITERMFSEMRWNYLDSPQGHYIPGRFFQPQNTVIRQVH